MTLKTAVIGVGMMGRNHARVYTELPDCALVAVSDANESTAASIAQRYGAAPYTDPLRLFEEQKPDAITIATPTEDHHAIAMEAIRRGIHLLIEKPIAYSEAEANEIIAAAQQASVHLTVGHIERFNPAVRELKRRLSEGELGRIFQVDARRQGPFPARVKDVGVVIDLAVHDLDVMRYTTGVEIVRVFAETEHRIHSTNEDLMSALVRLNDGIVGSLNINWLTPTKIREFCVTGERGMFRVDYLTQDLYFYENAIAQTDEGWETIKMLRGVSEGQMIRYVVAKKEPLRAELEAFLAAVTGTAPVAVTGEDGVRALVLAQAIVTSGQEHRMVEV